MASPLVHGFTASVLLWVAGVLPLLTGGCTTDADSRDASEAAATTVSPAPKNPVPDELQGTWLVDLTRAELRHDMDAAGFGRYSDQFINVERLHRRVRLTVTYTDDSFEVAWLYPDGWYVGWYGTADEADGVLTVTDAEVLASDAYRWSIDGDALTLRLQNTTMPDPHGIPFEAYSSAYFSRPLQQGDCTPADLDACWQG